MVIIFDATIVLTEDASKAEELRECGSRLSMRMFARFFFKPDASSKPTATTAVTKSVIQATEYQGHFDNMFSFVGDFFKAMGEDPANKRFGEVWARLTKNLLFDSKGNLMFKPKLWSDNWKVIVPTLVDKVGYIPILRIG